MATSAKVKGVNLFLKAKRMDANLTQLEAARYLGHSSPQYVSNFERGLCEPSIESAAKLCTLYGVSHHELYDLMVELYENDLKVKLALVKRKRTGRK